MKDPDFSSPTWAEEWLAELARQIKIEILKQADKEENLPSLLELFYDEEVKR